MKKEYSTGQKRKIIDFLKDNGNRHFTVEEIAENVCPEGTGKSTVYRHISKLHEMGVVRRFETPDKPSFVYQFADEHDGCDNHYHLKCVKCGRLIHMECSRLDEAREHIKEEHGFLIGCERAVIYGECVECAKKEK